ELSQSQPLSGSSLHVPPDAVVAIRVELLPATRGAGVVAERRACRAGAYNAARSGGNSQARTSARNSGRDLQRTRLRSDFPRSALGCDARNRRQALQEKTHDAILVRVPIVVGHLRITQPVAYQLLGLRRTSEDQQRLLRKLRTIVRLDEQLWYPGRPGQV